MKTITINFTHDEVFEDFVKRIVESELETKYINNKNEIKPVVMVKQPQHIGMQLLNNLNK